ncbi:PAAR domain-containing protein [Paraburkholderia adhaesiva]|uniref:PAAR domain-containing protein n=1 Tax=Paraburkholderia adhaesiva TaxID=2883244 RepID=UPI001F15AF24|nr:PAAR domain-containing protein [Paraburkholderia adhaesiva]
MRRRIAVVGDTLDGGGEILAGDQGTGFRAHGHVAALIGSKAYCSVCESTGVIAKAGGPHRPVYGGSREIALDGDIVCCNCSTPRRVVATLAGETWHDDLAERQDGKAVAKPKAS